MAEWLRWRAGRLGSGYRKMLLAHVDLGDGLDLLGFDAWLIDYAPGASIPPHIDAVPFARHFRLNLVLATGGARFDGRSIWRLGERVIFFRPDLASHGVAPCARRRVVLSVGWATRRARDGK